LALAYDGSDTMKKVMKVEKYLNSVLMIFLVYNSLQGTLIYIALHD